MINVLAENNDNNLLIIILIVVGIVALIAIINLFKTIEIDRSIVKSKLKLTGEMRLDPDDVDGVKARAQIVVANRNFQNVNLISFGIYYDHKMYDYILEYKNRKNLPATEKVYVLSQDSLIMELDIKQIREIVCQTKHIKKIQVFAQDNVGRISKASGATIRKFIMEEITKEKTLLKMAEKPPVEPVEQVEPIVIDKVEETAENNLPESEE